MGSQVWAPVVAGFIGGVTGIAGSIIVEWYKNRRPNKLDADRKTYLVQLLSDQRWEWRELTTLSHIIGADEETTKRLLIECGARASADGKQQWALLSRKPFPDSQ